MCQTQEASPPPRGQQIREIFEKWDEHKSGLITEDGLRAVLDSVQPPLSTADINAVCKLADKGTGQIRYNDFLDLLYDDVDVRQGTGMISISVALSLTREVILEDVRCRLDDTVGSLQKEVQKALGGQPCLLMHPEVSRSLKETDTVGGCGLGDGAQLMAFVDGMFEQLERQRSEPEMLLRKGTL
mmetsp:Transcript_4743/g.6054  ORF Transcript_4743/g.6054 Transcript_4743/m.6054 type:complete len:185 (+) Transcript_4743:57-611(+)